MKFKSWARTSIRKYDAKTSQGQMAVNAKILTRPLYKTATTLQHYEFALLSKHNNHIKISSRFSKVEDA